MKYKSSKQYALIKINSDKTETPKVAGIVIDPPTVGERFTLYGGFFSAVFSTSIIVAIISKKDEDIIQTLNSVYRIVEIVPIKKEEVQDLSTEELVD